VVRGYLVEIYCRDHNLRRPGGNTARAGVAAPNPFQPDPLSSQGNEKSQGSSWPKIASSRRPTIPQPGLAAASPPIPRHSEAPTGTIALSPSKASTRPRTNKAPLSLTFACHLVCVGVYVDTATGEYSSAQLSIDFCTANHNRTNDSLLFSFSSPPLLLLSSSGRE
jgi:hypothetical protein